VGVFFGGVAFGVGLSSGGQMKLKEALLGIVFAAGAAYLTYSAVIFLFWVFG
jgi:hypothetical protein